METLNPEELFLQYCKNENQAAFTALVRHFTPLVYAAALRRTGRHDFAVEVAQCVFTDLGRKASSLTGDHRLGAWLHRRAVFIAADLLKAERRRHTRETTAFETITQTTDPTFPAEAEPWLDAALQSVSAEDRTALTLRYLEERNLRSVGSALGISDDAAQKRISRDLERLRSILNKKGISLTLLALTAGLHSRVEAAVLDRISPLLAKTALASAATPWWWKLWLHLPAAACGIVMGGSAAAFPVVFPTRAAATDRNQSSAEPDLQLHGPKLPAAASTEMPKFEPGFSTEEIVKRVVTLAKLPQNQLVGSRGESLLGLIRTPEEALRVVELLSAEFSEIPSLQWLFRGLLTASQLVPFADRAARIAWIEKSIRGNLVLYLVSKALVGAPFYEGFVKHSLHDNQLEKEETDPISIKLPPNPSDRRAMVGLPTSTSHLPRLRGTWSKIGKLVAGSSSDSPRA